MRNADNAKHFCFGQCFGLLNSNSLPPVCTDYAIIWPSLAIKKMLPLRLHTGIVPPAPDIRLRSLPGLLSGENDWT
jgi:hypothetical protein